MQSYIVYMGAHSHGANPSTKDFDQVTDYHHNFLANFVGRYAEVMDYSIINFVLCIKVLFSNLWIYIFVFVVLYSLEEAKDAMFYSYTRHINGFAANLEEHQAAEIAGN